MSRTTLEVKQGEDWSRTVSFEYEDGEAVTVTDYTAVMQVRDEDDAVVVELSTENDRITASGTTFTLALDQTETADLDPGSYEYDLFVHSPGGADICLLEGWFDVTERVTR